MWNYRNIDSICPFSPPFYTPKPPLSILLCECASSLSISFYCQYTDTLYRTIISQLERKIASFQDLLMPICPFWFLFVVCLYHFWFSIMSSKSFLNNINWNNSSLAKNASVVYLETLAFSSNVPSSNTLLLSKDNSNSFIICFQSIMCFSLKYSSQLKVSIYLRSRFSNVAVCLYSICFRRARVILHHSPKTELNTYLDIYKSCWRKVRTDKVIIGTVC